MSTSEKGSTDTPTATPRWIMHQGTAHIWHFWKGVSVVTWCDMTLVGVRATDFREPKGYERSCNACLDAKLKGE